MKRGNDIVSLMKETQNKEDHCSTPLIGLNERQSNPLVRPISIINLARRSSRNKSKNPFHSPKSTRANNAKFIFFRTAISSRKSSFDKKVQINKAKYEVEIINNLNDLITNIKYKDYLLNKIQNNNDIYLMNSYIAKIKEKSEKYYKALSVTNSKPVTTFNKEIERESLLRIKDYNECFSICFKLYDELVHCKEHINNSNINVNVNFNVNSISSNTQKNKHISRVFKREHKVSMDDNMISLLNEKKTKINTLHLYNFQVSKQQNGTKIIKRELNNSYDIVKLKK